MLDQTALNSVLNSGMAPQVKPKEEATDAEAFNAVLNDATTPKKGEKAEKGEAKSETKDSKEKKQREVREQEDKDSKVAHQQTLDRGGALQMRKLMSKNVDTLSLAEKQALRVAEFANADQQNVKTAPQLALQPQALPTQQAAKSGKSGRPSDTAVGKEASSKVRVAAERADEKGHEVAEEMHKKEQGKSSSTSNLDQKLVKEANFADELQKSSSADRARERQSVVDQIMQQIEVRNFANRTELHMKLNPEYLGELKVKLVHTDDGIRCDFETSSRATRQLLREGEEELKTAAAGKGVRMRSMKVTLVDKVDADTTA